MTSPARGLAVYAVRPDGSDLRRLTMPAARGDWARRHWSTSPRWSRDGGLIALTRARPWGPTEPCRQP